MIDWVMRVERVSFRHAVEWLRARAGRAPVQALTPMAASATEADAIDDGALVRDVLDFYHETLKASPEAIAYLETRGLNSVALIDHFRLGYANRTLGYRLQGSRWKAGATLRGRLQSVGLLRPPPRGSPEHPLGTHHRATHAGVAATTTTTGAIPEGADR